MIADTHVGEWAPELPSAALDALRGVDAILHAGDITDVAVLAVLAEIAPVYAVQGDHDRAAGIDLPRQRVVEVAGRRFGVTHGRRNRGLEALAAILSLTSGRPRLLGFHRAMRRRFTDVDCVVHGHLHLPFDVDVGGVRCFSPGAVHNAEHAAGFAAGGIVARLYLRFRRSLDPERAASAVGIIEVHPGGLTTRIVPLPSP